jgi:hypothetical protein
LVFLSTPHEIEVWSSFPRGQNLSINHTTIIGSSSNSNNKQKDSQDLSTTQEQFIPLKMLIDFYSYFH